MNFPDNEPLAWNGPLDRARTRRNPDFDRACILVVVTMMLGSIMLVAGASLVHIL